MTGLVRRGPVFWIRIRIPGDVVHFFDGKREYTKSLRTRDRREALKALSLERIKFELEIEAARRRFVPVLPNPAEGTPGIRLLDTREIERIILTWFHEEEISASKADRELRSEASGLQQRDLISDLQLDETAARDELQGRLGPDEPSPVESTTAALLAKHNLTLDRSSSEYLLIKDLVGRGMMEQYRRRRARLRGLPNASFDSEYIPDTYFDRIVAEKALRSYQYNGPATRTTVTLRRDLLAAGSNLAEQNIDVDYEEVEKPTTFFRIRVSDLYSENEVKEEKRRKLIGAFADKNFANAIFEKYAEHIFTSRLTVRINGKAIDPKEYLVSGPFPLESEFVTLDGAKHKVGYQLIQLKTVSPLHRIFLRQSNAGMQTVGHVLTYEASIPEPYQWFAYVDSDYFDQHANVFRTIELLGESSPDSKKILDLIRADVDKFFAARYPAFHDFIAQLKVDTFYPYRVSRAPSEKAVAKKSDAALPVPPPVIDLPVPNDGPVREASSKTPIS